VLAPGIIVRLVQPLLLAHPIESLSFSADVAMAHAVIYDPAGQLKAILKTTLELASEARHPYGQNFIRMAELSPG
jgi:hypothetical protein